MLPLNATALLAKRQTLIDSVVSTDYQSALDQLTTFFEKEENLLLNDPSVLIKIGHSLTKAKLITQLRSNGFTVQEDEVTNNLTVKLPISDSFTEVQNEVVIEQPKEEPIVIQEVVKQPESVAVKTPSYSHTDLQMSGKDPF